MFDIQLAFQRDPVSAGLLTLPFIYFVCIAFNSFTVTYNGSERNHYLPIHKLNDLFLGLGLKHTPFWLAVLISISLGVLAAIAFWFVGRKYLLKWIERKLKM
jgi:hypothetical protein